MYRSALFGFWNETSSNRTVYKWFTEFQCGCIYFDDEFGEFTSVVAANFVAVREMIE